MGKSSLATSLAEEREEKPRGTEHGKFLAVQPRLCPTPPPARVGEGKAPAPPLRQSQMAGDRAWKAPINICSAQANMHFFSFSANFEEFASEALSQDFSDLRRGL